MKIDRHGQAKILTQAEIQSYGLNNYSNRKPGKSIDEVINLAELVPCSLA